MGDGEHELAAQLLDRAADDVAAASALLEVAGVSDAIVVSTPGRLRGSVMRGWRWPTRAAVIAAGSPSSARSVA